MNFGIELVFVIRHERLGPSRKAFPRGFRDYLDKRPDIEGFGDRPGKAHFRYPFFIDQFIETGNKQGLD
jgi:hypothetical protein